MSEGCLLFKHGVNGVVLVVIVIMNVAFGAWSRCRGRMARKGAAVGQPLTVCERQQIEGEWFSEK